MSEERTTSSTMDDLGMAAAHRLVAIDQQRTELEARKKELNAERAEVEAGLLVYFEQSKLRSLRIGDPPRTVHLSERRSIRPKDGDQERAVQVATDWGFRDAVRILTQTMSKLVKDAGGLEETPPAIQAAFEETVKKSVRTRRSP